MAKKPWFSWTLWINFVVAGGALFYPPVAEFVSGHPQEVMIAFTVVNVILRLITKGKISLVA